MPTDSRHIVLGAFASSYRGDTQSVLASWKFVLFFTFGFNEKHTVHIVAISATEKILHGT